MNGNMTFTRVPKKKFTNVEAEMIIEHISKRSVEISGEKIPAFAHGYLVSMLTTLANKSPSAARELLGDVEYIKSM